MTYLNRISAMAVLVLAAVVSGLPAQAIGFKAPAGQGAPSQATGGASRGEIKFAPARGMAAPSQATGGASRGGIKFAPALGQGAPSQATGGASRGSFFKAPKGQSMPGQATGGASRGAVFFKPAKGQAAPLRASGGASRTGRYDLTEVSANGPTGAAGPAAVMAMLPQNYTGNTISDRPTIMVYLPASAASQASFSLKDAAGNTLYQKNLAVSGKAEVMAIALPAEAPALQVGQTYQWYMGLQVDGNLGPSMPYVDGWIQRVEPSATVAAALQQSDLFKQAEVLGAEGVWYDCAAKLASLRAQSPGNANLDKEWTDLLGAVGLQELSAMPVVVAAQ
jgi:Domain of Unknown Function (DUF928)